MERKELRFHCSLSVRRCRPSWSRTTRQMGGQGKWCTNHARQCVNQFWCPTVSQQVVFISAQPITVAATSQDDIASDEQLASTPGTRPLISAAPSVSPPLYAQSVLQYCSTISFPITNSGRLASAALCTTGHGTRVKVVMSCGKVLMPCMDRTDRLELCE